MENGNVTTVSTRISVNGSVASDDVYLSVRVHDGLVDEAIQEINKLGFAAKRMELA